MSEIESFYNPMTHCQVARMTHVEDLQKELAAERAKVEQLRWAILSVMPDGPYDPVMEPEWLYCAEALAATEPAEGSRAP